jgi:hypothetical protein
MMGRGRLKRSSPLFKTRLVLSQQQQQQEMLRTSSEFFRRTFCRVFMWVCVFLWSLFAHAMEGHVHAWVGTREGRSRHTMKGHAVLRLPARLQIELDPTSLGIVLLFAASIGAQ